MKLKGALLTVFITAILCFVYYSFQITNADKIVFGEWGDGYKNYYTLAYYLAHDHGSHFSGMNYPYGENVLFTDNQPAFAWILKGAIKICPGLVNHIHGFIIYAFFTSLLLTSAFTFLILFELSGEVLLAALFAALIAMLSPQVKRLLGHYSLSYSFYIPLVTYLILRFFKTSGSLNYVILLTTVITFFSFVHVYYLAMGGLFLLTTAFFYFVANYTTKSVNFRLPFLLIFSGLTPLVILKMFLFFTDPVTDRPATTWGALVYCSSIFDIIAHPNSFTGEIAARLFPNGTVVYNGEGLGYIGFISTFSIAAIFILSLITLFKKGPNYLKQFEPFNYLLPASFCILLFAMAFPFKFSSIENYYEFMPSAFKQFRALGRFSWVFYYTTTILSALFLISNFQKIKLRSARLAYFFVTAILSIWFADMNMVSIRYQREFNNSSALLNEQQDAKNISSALAKIGKSANNYQAILAIPMFLNGSEKLCIEATAVDAMKASLYTGLPLACSQMSRTSEQQTFKIARLLSEDYLKKDILSDYKSSLPLLLVQNKDVLREQEKKVLSRATYLFTANGAKYYELPLSAFSNSRDSIMKIVRNNKNSYFKHNQYYTSDSINRVVLLSFEKEKVPYAIFGKGAHQAERKKGVMFSDTLPHGMQDSTYEISFWAYSDDRKAVLPVMYITEEDEFGNGVANYGQNLKVSFNIYGKWAYGNVYLTLLKAKNKIHIYGEEGEFNSYDEIMIRPVNTTVISNYINSSNFMFNNFPIIN